MNFILITFSNVLVWLGPAIVSKLILTSLRCQAKPSMCRISPTSHFHQQVNRTINFESYINSKISLTLFPVSISTPDNGAGVSSQWGAIIFRFVITGCASAMRLHRPIDLHPNVSFGMPMPPMNSFRST